LSGGSAEPNSNSEPDSEPELKKNDIVIFAGDFKKDRRWLIRKIKGNFAKIETNDFSEGLSPENSTNIVELRNLKKADLLIPEPTLKPVGQLVPQGQQSQLAQPAQQMPTQPVQINVVTGNNNKLTESPSIETTPMIKRPNNESNANNVSFSEMMMSSSGDDADKIDSIPTGSKSGPIIVRKI
jgi:hypothetical protein